MIICVLTTQWKLIMQNIIIDCTVMFRMAILTILAIMFPLNVNSASSEESTLAIQAFWKVMLH